MKSMKTKLSGIFAPVNTPFSRNEGIDYEGLKSNLQFYLNSQLNGVLLLGSNSEYKSLDEDEKIKILEISTEIIAGKKIIMVGLMYDSLWLAKKFIENVRDLKINYLLVQPPFYFRAKFTEDDYYQYYLDLIELSPFPILIYNAPGFTGVDLSESLINRIAELEEIVGIKDSSKQVKQLSSKLSVLTGTANTLYDMLEKDAVGGVVSLANYLPELPVQIYNEYVKGNKEKAKALQAIAIKLNKSVSGENGVAGVKGAMDAMGLIGGYLRKPLKKLQTDEIDKIGNLVKEYYLDE
jgi:4-hydroxy-2-oxoglutarate aldolase